MRSHAYLLKKAYLKPREVARLLDRPVRAIYYLLAIGKLPGCKIGGLWVVPTMRLVGLLDQLETKAFEEVLKVWNVERSVMKCVRAAKVVQARKSD